MTKLIAVTGANGFLGSRLCVTLADNKYKVLKLQRSAPTSPGSLQVDLTKILSPELEMMLAGVDVVVHCAARAHLVRDNARDPETEYLTANTEATLKLANAAVKAGVTRFVFLSSIKVHGESNQGKAAISELEQLAPRDPYGRSKLLAEIGLTRLSEETDLEVVIIRPPLVYGPGVKANLDSLARWMKKNYPLPFGSVNNRRSMIGLRNLCEFITVCVQDPRAKNEAFLVSDSDDVSVGKLIREMKNASQSQSVIFPVPVGLLWSLAWMLGKSDVARRLLGDLFIDSSKAARLLAWVPPYTVEQELKYMFASNTESYDE